MLKIQHPANQGQAPVSASDKVALPFIVKGPGVATAVEIPSADGTSAAATASNTDIPLNAEDLKDPRLEQVLRLAKRGCRLFPLIPHGKVPMKDFSWKELATTVKHKFLAWLKQFSE